MLTPLLTDKELITLMRLIQEARRIVVCGHRSPDGDALGSAIGWTLYLRSLRKTTNIVMPNPFPDFLRTVPGAGMTVLYDRQPDTAQRYIREADLIFCLDFNALSRLENMGETIARSQAKKVIIDHHLDPDSAVAALRAAGVGAVGVVALHLGCSGTVRFGQDQFQLAQAERVL